MTDFKTYNSPFSWRYGSDEMRQIWSLDETRQLWRQLWVALAEVEAEYGLVTQEQVEELRQNQSKLDLDRSREIEDQIQHDLMAELKVYAEQCPAAGRILHLGATSMDIKDNASVLQQIKAIDLLINKTREILSKLAELIQEYADLSLIAYTHLQPAEPSTFGYRLALTGQDLLSHYQLLFNFRQRIKAKGFTGAVGSSASFSVLLGDENLPEFQKKLAQHTGLVFCDVTSQTYPRIQEYELLSILTGFGAILSKFAFDLRILQSPGFGELAEPFGKEQVGSSAMPFKRNPIKAEKINSLARQLAQLPRIAWDNAANSLLERTLDDSANRRSILPEAFLITDELLRTSLTILGGLQINQKGIAQNLDNYGPFAATELLLMKLVKAGADRQEMHGIIREHSLEAWMVVQTGKPNPLEEILRSDPLILDFLSEAEVQDCFSGSSYLGDSEIRSRDMAQKILKEISS